jgi:hypothetical protein
MKRMTVAGLDLALAGVCCVPLNFAQSANPVQAPIRVAHEFTRIAGACTRADGSAIVSDDGEAAVIRIGSDGSARQLGRRGAGPGEYQHPGACFLLRGDTVLILDRLLRRFLVVAPDDKLGTLAFPVALRGWYEPLGVDEQDRVVLQGTEADGRAPVLAWNRGSGSIDTVLTLDVGTPRRITVGAMSMARDIPFMPRDGATAGRALGLAVVHPEPFVVDVRRGATTRRDPPIPWTPVAVDNGDIEAYLATQAPPPGTVARGSDGRVASVPTRRWTLENFGLTRADIPVRKPAFDPNGLVVSPAGALWIRLHRPSSERGEQYVVRELDGRRDDPITLPAGRRLVGLGANEVLLAFVNEDGIQFLERLGLRR